MCVSRASEASAQRERSEDPGRPKGYTAALCGCIVAASIGALGVAPNHAQDAYPSRTVKVIIPSAGGSTTDMLARLLAEQLAQKWATPVIVENVSGGGMVIGSTQAFRSPPDGYTLFICPPSPVTFIDLLYRDLPFRPKDFVPISLLAKIPNALVVRKDFPAQSVSGLLDYAKKNPNKVTFGSQGLGSTAQLSAHELELLGAVKMVHVPYRGAVPALNDVIAGHIDMFFDTLTTSVPMYRAEKVRILAVGGAERSAVVPEIPTVAESGLPGFRSVTWFAMVGPPGLPAALAEKINRDVVEGLQRPDVVDKLQRLTLEPMPGSPQDAARFFDEETALWARVIQEKNVTAE
jgi:tripartite-type tricarboxylate transporter receptor subunit TctC